jgi:ribosomal protein L11 methyltransferase PrmA/PRMT5 arginine-N-methyltransferase
MYSIYTYGRMIADDARLGSYVAALQSAIKPGSTVADIGTGPGLFALIACQLGAERVYAIEPDNVIQVAREAAIANGFADRIEFIQDFSTRVTLPQRVDVIVSDLRGVLPLFEQHLPSIQDARLRLLRTGGTLIAKRDTLWAAPVDVAETYEKVVGPWNHGKFNLVLTPALKRATNTWAKAHIKPEALLGKPVLWHTLDYTDFVDSNVRSNFSLPIERSGVAHGFAIWFDCVVSDSISFSNCPGNEESIYGNAFFPFPQPVDVNKTTSIDIQLRADLVGEDYVWQWETTVSDHEARSSIPTTFKQSTLLGTPLTQSQLQTRAANHVPELTSGGKVDYFVLSQIDGRSSLEEIARKLCGKFPDRFKTFEKALDAVGDLSNRYSKLR